MLLIGNRLGHVPKGEIRSITQIEFDHARRLGIYIFPFMLTKQSVFQVYRPPYMLDGPESAAFQEWRKEICERYGVGFFTRPAESVPVATSVARWLISRQLPLPSSLSLSTVLADETQDADVRGFFAGRPDLVKLAFVPMFGRGLHVVPDFRIGAMQFDYAIGGFGAGNAPPWITYISLKGCQDKLLGGAIGETMDTIDCFLDDPERGKYEPCSETRGKMINDALASREDYRELAFYRFSESAVLVGGRRHTLSKKELEIMRGRNAVPGRLEIRTWDTISEHIDGLLATARGPGFENDRF